MIYTLQFTVMNQLLYFQTSEESQLWFIFRVVYVIILLYFALCAVWFIHRTSNTPDQGKLLSTRKQKQVKKEEAKEEEKEEKQPLHPPVDG